MSLLRDSYFPDVPGVLAANTLQVSGTADSASPNTGCFVVAGGVGVAGAIYIGGPAVVVNTTPSTSISTGAMIVSGGLGIAGDTHVGGGIDVAGNSVFDGDLTVYGTISGVITAIPAGNNQAIQYNDHDHFAGSDSLQFDNTINKLTVGNGSFEVNATGNNVRILSSITNTPGIGATTYSIMQGCIKSTDATPMEIFSYCGTCETSMIVQSTVHGVVTNDTGQVAGFTLSTMYKYIPPTGPLLLGGVTSLLHRDLAAMNAYFGLDGTDIVLYVVGAVGKNITWHATTILNYFDI